MPNAIHIEEGSPRNQNTYVEPQRMVAGAILAPETPGMGSELRREFIEKNRVK